MTREIFIFIACLLLLLPVVFYAGDISSSHQLVICIPFILMLGIPHGAIDNVLYLRGKEIKNSRFIAVYLVFVFLNVALWLFVPNIAYLLFLFLSAYHFGQSQFSHYFSEQLTGYKILYLLWGVAILSALVYFNITEIQQIISQESDFAVLAKSHHLKTVLAVFLVASSATVVLLAVLSFNKRISVSALLMEYIVFALVLISFYLMPLIIGFTLYFIILHSLKVLREEYKFLIGESEVKSVFTFVKLVAPFTLFSFAGIAFLFALIYFDLLNLSYGYCLLIIISSITLPHVFVMNKFYNYFISAKYRD
jgi:Brp/Blh family beta-carotene 15,15'-monooxygenase